MSYILLVFVVGLLLQFVIGLYFLRKLNLTNGSQEIKLTDRRKGWIYILTNISMLFLFYSDRFVLGNLHFIDLALYSVLLTYFRGFDLLIATLGPILSVKIKKVEEVINSRNILLMLSIGCLMGSVFYVVVPWFTDWYYAGKYAINYTQVGILAMIGILKLLELLPSSFFYGNASFRTLSKYSMFTFSFSLVYIVILFVLTKNYSVIGTLVSVLSFTVTKLFISYSLIYREVGLFNSEKVEGGRSA